MTMLIPMLQFLAPSRLWLLLLIPALVGLYLLLVQRKRQPRASRWAGPCSTWSSRGTGPGCGTSPSACRSSAC